MSKKIIMLNSVYFWNVIHLSNTYVVACQLKYISRKKKKTVKIYFISIWITLKNLIEKHNFLNIKPIYCTISKSQTVYVYWLAHKRRIQLKVISNTFNLISLLFVITVSIITFIIFKKIFHLIYKTKIHYK